MAGQQFIDLLDSLNSESSITGGGNSDFGNIYLWAIIAILIYYVFGSSLPMSSAFLILLIGYIIYSTSSA